MPGRPPLPRARGERAERPEHGPAARHAPERPAVPEAPPLQIELRTRAEALTDSDPVAAARALVELGLFEERVQHDRKTARRYYEDARSLVRSLEPALCRTRRLFEGKSELGPALVTIEDELAVAEGEPRRADLLAERARICEALGRAVDARTGYAEALTLVPHHAASLRGLEAVLRREMERGDKKATDRALAAQLAAHLERLADAYAPSQATNDGDARLAAWIHVERASVLDRHLKQTEHALAALQRAVAFEPAPGPVRDALTRHLVLHRSTNELVASLSVEADHERDDERASRLLYTASRLAIDVLQAVNDAIGLLSRAAQRMPVTAPTARRVFAELIRVLETVGELAAAADVRQRRLALLGETEAVVHEHVRLSEIFDALGLAAQAAAHAEHALRQAPEDSSTRDRLDRALQRLGRHDDRVAAWVVEGNAKRPIAVRVRAFVRAADIADRHLRRRDDAITYLRNAWVIDPGNSEVFDVLSALLAPPAREPEGDAQDVRGVRARIDLYTQAAHAAKDPARKIGLLEKLVSIWEDELGQPARAIEEIERILEIDPNRRMAILALERNAERAGDGKQLARALVAESAVTSDPNLKRRLLLRAADVLADRVGDRDRSLALVERALAIDPADPDALRARYHLDDKMGRYDDARKALLALINREPNSAEAFSLWIDVALLDEHRLKRPVDAVQAYQQAAKIKPRHPLPKIEIARLLREAKDYPKLVEALTALAADAADAAEFSRLLFEAAEVQELCIGNDEAALKTLQQADSTVASGGEDPAIFEAMERIHVRRSSGTELAALYTRWLERHPPPTLDHALRIALAGVLSERDKDKKDALEILQALLGVAPNHVPALRMSENLFRATANQASLATTLRAEADVFMSRIARCGALWELVALEEQVGPSVTIEALERIVVDSPTDTAALEAIIRIASKLVGGVAIPHPAALATRAKLMAALQARRELVGDGIARAFYHLEEAILHEAHAGEDAAPARAALGSYHQALALWPESLLAARGLDRLAQRLGDRPSLITAQLTLAKLVQSSALRASHYVRAAELLSEDTSPQAQYQALECYEDALRIDADSRPAAVSVARMLTNDPSRLVDRLSAALESATIPEQVSLLAAEIARCVLRHLGTPGAPDTTVGVSAMRRALEQSPDDIAALGLMSRLLQTQQLWAEARDVLVRIVEVAPDQQERVAAHFSLAELYEGPLSDPELAEASLQAVLAIDAKNRRALERLHNVAIARGDRALAMSVLGRLVETETDPAARVEYGLRLADACREAGDNAGVVRALCEAIVSLPSDLRAWNALARLFRPETPDGAAAYAKALGQLIDTAAARRAPVDPRWLTTLGLIEISTLMRPRDGLAHLQQAVSLPGAGTETRVAFGRGLQAANRNSEAIQVLRDVLTSDGETLARLLDVAAAFAALETALANEGRVEERLAVEEVRACLGDAKPDRMHRLRARRLSPDAPYPMTLAGSEIARLLVPEARSPMIDVSVAIAPIAARALRFDLANLGVTSRERISSRDMHSTRLLADRLARCLGIENYELYLTPTWQGALRVYPGDPPAIVGPTSFAELPEPEQAFALGRLLTRVALGLTWLDELAIEAVDGLLIAAVRMVEPSFGQNEISPMREQATQNFMVHVGRAIGRRQRKLLEEIAPSVSAAYDARAFTIGVRRSEYRIAYVLCGDLVSAIDYLRRFDREIARASDDPRVLLQHPVTNELIRYAMTPEAYAERRRIGTVWAK